MKLISSLLIIFTLSSTFAQSKKALKEANIDGKHVKATSNLLKRARVQDAFVYIDEQDEPLMKTLIDLTEVPAPPFGEEKRAKMFKDMLESAGVDSAWIDEVGNVIALRKGTNSKKTVALDAHLDTVFPEETDVTVTRKGDTLYAPGVGDDTRGLAMVLQILRAMNHATIETENDLLFVGTVGEEGIGDLRGVKHLFSEKSDVKIDSWIGIDGGSVGRINYKALGSVRYRANFSGPGGHSWGAFGLANPHHALAKAIDYFTMEAGKYVAKGPKTSFNIGRIGGGTSVNSIPFESWFEVDIRSLDPMRIVAMDSLFKSNMERAVDDYNKSGVEDKVILNLEPIGDRPSGELSRELPLIQRSIASTILLGARLRETTGSTNGNIPISLGIPSVTIGRGGRGKNAHSLDEWWANIDGARAIKLALLITVSEAGLSN
ncbi:M20/M25/M40 family metallo-hydrolase [Ekhidna sp.]